MINRKSRFFLYLCILLPALSTSYIGKAPEASVGFNTYLNDSEKKIHIGASSFIDLVANGVFVDKTLFLNNILKNITRNSLVICPRKWGKSINLNMLKTFIQIQVHPNGSRVIPISATPNYQLFIEGKYHWNNYSIKLQKPFLISNNNFRRTIGEYLGRYPIISLSFKGISSPAKNYTTKLSEIIAKAFEEHKYLLEKYDRIINAEAILEAHQSRIENIKRRFNAYLNGQVDNEKELEQSLPFLLEQLHDHFKDRKVFVFIDDYGEMFKDGPPPTVAQTIIANILVSSYLKHALFIASLRTHIEDDPLTRTFLIRTYYPFHGFLKQEMDLLTTLYQMKSKERKIIRYWYGGYGVIPKYEEDKVCNPWSISNYVNSRELKPYWMTDDLHDPKLDGIFESLEFQYPLSRFLAGKHYDFDQNKPNEFFNRTLNHLYFSGYLAKSIAKSPLGVIYTYMTTNYEVALSFQSIFASKLSKLFDTKTLEILYATASVWETFLSTNEQYCPELQNLTQQSAAALQPILENDSNNPTDGLEPLRRTVLLSTIMSKELNFLNYQFAYTTSNGVDKILMEPEFVFTSKQRGFIVDIKHGEGMDSVENRTVHYYRKFEQYPSLHSWKDMKIVFIELMPNSSVNIYGFPHPIYEGIPQNV